MCPVCGSAATPREVLDPRRGPSPLFRCQGCGVVRWAAAWQPPAMAHYHDYYGGRTPTYDPVTETRYHAILDTLERWVRPGRVLDAGCGMGHFLMVAEDRGWEAVGLEVSASGVETLNEMKRARGRRFEVHAEELLKTELPAESFRAVTLFEVIEHLADPVENLRAVHRLLEPRGVLYLTTPNFDSLSRAALRGEWRGITPDHLTLFTPGALRRCLRLAGFEPLRVATKNVDVPEILAKWRRRRAQPVATFEATRSFRHAVERRPTLQALKRVVNGALRATGLGETIEAVALKP